MKLLKSFIFVALSLYVVGGIFVNADSSITMQSFNSRHISKLHSLYLKNSNSKLWIDDDRLTATNGVVAGRNNTSKSTMSSIGGGKDNQISSDSEYAGIGGGHNNDIVGKGGIIGGGESNKVDGNYAVVVGGSSNTVSSSGTVVGGNSNSANGLGVALGGSSNHADDSDLVLGNNASGRGGSFVWNAQVSDYNGGQINARKGILIGTTKSITGVNLVVSGAIKLNGSDNQLGSAGEIKVVGGCFYAYDGSFWNLINQNSADDCVGILSVSKNCQFGSVILKEGDEVYAYSKTASNNCAGDREKVVCSGGRLYHGSDTSYIYPYCFEY